MRVTVRRERPWVPRLRRQRRRLVDVPAAVSVVGSVLRYISLMFFAPAAVAVYYDESTVPYLVAFAVSLGVGLLLERLTGDTEAIGLREVYLIVSLTWLAVAAVGAIPFLLLADDQLGRPVDAYFEAMSGFTTTGASVLTDIERLPRSALFWRNMTQWLGGMGIIVLALAILPRLSVGGQQLMAAEAPGPGRRQVDAANPGHRTTTVAALHRTLDW